MLDFVCDGFNFAYVYTTKERLLIQKKQDGRERSVSAQTLFGKTYATRFHAFLRLQCNVWLFLHGLEIKVKIHIKERNKEEHDMQHGF